MQHIIEHERSADRNTWPDEPTVDWLPPVTGQSQSCFQYLSLARKRRDSEQRSSRAYRLRDPRTAEAENRYAIFRGADRRNAGMEPMLTFAPFLDIHGRNDERLCPLADEFIGDPRVTQIVTNTQAQLAPG